MATKNWTEQKYSTSVDLMNAVVPPKRRFSQEPYGVTSQKTEFFNVTDVKTSKLVDLLRSYVLYFVRILNSFT
jgi:hypothetical protein